MKKRVISILLSAAMVASLAMGCGNETASTATTSSAAASTAASAAASTAASTAASKAASTAASTAASKAASTAASTAADTSVSGNVTFVSQNDTTGALDDMIKAFNVKYPNIKVDHQMTSGASDDVKKSLMTSFAAGDTDPDVIECDIIWVSQFAAAGWLMDLTSDLDKVKDQYLGGPLKTCYYDGKAYAYPDYTDVGLLYYRKDLVSTPPKTWDELVQDCKDNMGKNGIENGFAFQMFQGEPTSCNMLEFIKQDGGSDLTDGKFAMDNDKTYEALNFVEGLISDGISPESVLNNKPDDSKALFESGNTLFMRNWTYAYASAQKDTSKVAGKVGVTQLPVGPNGKSSSGTLGGWNMAINVNTDAPEASKLFVQFMTSYDAQKIEAMERSTLPTVSKVYDDAEVQTKLPFLADVKDAADNAAPRPQVKDYPTISTIFQEYFHKALTGAQSNEDAMKEMNTKLNDALAAMG